MTLRTKHNEFNTSQINIWLNNSKTVPVNSPARVFQLEGDTFVKVGDKVQFNGQAAKIPKGIVEIKELRVGNETHQVMMALEYNGDLFYYHACDFSAAPVKSTGIPKKVTCAMTQNMFFSDSSSMVEPEASFNAYGLTEVKVKGTTYLLDGNELCDLNTHLYNLGVYRRETK